MNIHKFQEELVERGYDKVGKVWLCCNLFDMKPVNEFKIYY